MGQRIRKEIKMEYNIEQILFCAAVVMYTLTSYFKTRSQNKRLDLLEAKIPVIEENIALVAKNPQLARRRLKNK
jgi:hypothetical protein|tara:strand:- start:206 stop:427 length:222 start_codon:yes stop_codon:yes gene_type:complete